TESRGTSRHVVRRKGHQVRLEEVNAGSREFENFREVGRRQLFHAHQTFRRVLQNVDRAVVGGVVNRVAPCEGVNDPGKPLFRFHERLHGAAGERLNRGADGADGQGGEAGARSSREFNKRRAVDGGGAVNGQTNEFAQGLTQAVRHFLGNVAQGVVDCGGQGERRKRRVIGVFTDGRGVRDQRGRDTGARRSFGCLRNVGAERVVFEQYELVAAI